MSQTAAQDVTSIDQLKALPKYAELRWRDTPGDGDGVGRLAYAFIESDRELGWALMIAAIESGSVDRAHVHPGGELIVTYGGELHIGVDGAPETHTPDMDAVWLEPRSMHRPSADFWWGIYFVPGGIAFPDDD